MHDQFVPLKELRERMGYYSQQVAMGKSFIILKRSKPLFKVSPVDNVDGWEEVIDFTKIKKGGVDIKDILKRL